MPRFDQANPHGLLRNDPALDVRDPATHIQSRLPTVHDAGRHHPVAGAVSRGPRAAQFDAAIRIDHETKTIHARGPAVDFREHRFEGMRQIEIIVVEIGHDLAVGPVDRVLVWNRLIAGVLRKVLPDHPRIVEARNDLRRVIRTSVTDDPQFEIPHRLPKDASDREGEDATPVISRNDHTDAWHSILRKLMGIDTESRRFRGEAIPCPVPHAGKHGWDDSRK